MSVNDDNDTVCVLLQQILSKHSKESGPQLAARCHLTMSATARRLGDAKDPPLRRIWAGQGQHAKHALSCR